MVPAPAAELDERARRIAGRFHLDVPGWFGATDQVPTLTGLVDAVWNQRVVRLRDRAFDPRDDAGPVEVHPLGLVLKTGRWYLVGTHRVDGSTSGPHVHPVGRIEDLRVSDARFTRPAGFDLGRAWSAALVAPGSPAHRVEATLRLSPRGRALAPAVLRPHTARAVAETAGPPGDDGWCRAVVGLESLADARRELLALGGEVEVLAPAVLREQMSDAAGALAALYRAG